MIKDLSKSIDASGVDWLIAFRRELHASPELGFQEHQTAEKLATKLRGFGLDVSTGIGGTGIVASLKRGRSRRSIGLRADMDALPIQEETGLPYASQTSGVFHGCGHDGHATMLLAAARLLTDTTDLDGTVHFIFQPAEEGLAGAQAMIQDGLFQRFPCDHVFAIHNWPEMPAGTIATRAGPIMAAADKFEIELIGRGGHAALPHQTPDIILAASELVCQLNRIVSRSIPATASAVLSVTQIAAGRTHNVLPETCKLMGTVRTFSDDIQKRIEAAIRSAIAGIEGSHQITSRLDYTRYYPATVNDPAAVEQVLALSDRFPGIMVADTPSFCSEDFSFMLREKSGAYIWLGQYSETTSRALHHPEYDFNDAILPVGGALYAALAQSYLVKNG